MVLCPGAGIDALPVHPTPIEVTATERTSGVTSKPHEPSERPSERENGRCRPTATATAAVVVSLRRGARGSYGDEWKNENEMERRREAKEGEGERWI